MSIHLSRVKPKKPVFSIAYRLNRALPVSPKHKLRFWLAISWMADRLAHEESFLHYERERHPFFQSKLDYLTPLLEKNHRVLDLGCAYGQDSRAIAGLVGQVVGVELNPHSYEVASAADNPPNVRFVLGEAREFLINSPDSFDVLILSHILEHLDDPAQFIRDFRDFFRWIYIELPDFEKGLENLYRVEVGSELNYSDDDHIVEFSRADILRLLAEAGLEVRGSEYRFGIQRYWCEVVRQAA